MVDVMKPGNGQKPIDPAEITKLEPVDDLQLTKVYGQRSNFSGWPMPDLPNPKSGDDKRTFSGHLQQMFCMYKTPEGRSIIGEWWTINVSGRGSMNDNVAPGYVLKPDKATRSMMPQKVDVDLVQFSQFFDADNKDK
jgi:hypothetical protein